MNSAALVGVLVARCAHEVGKLGLVFLMPDASNNRDWEFGDGFSDEVMVEEEKIGLRTTSPDDDYGIINLFTTEIHPQTVSFDQSLYISLSCTTVK